MSEYSSKKLHESNQNEHIGNMALLLSRDIGTEVTVDELEDRIKLIRKEPTELLGFLRFRSTAMVGSYYLRYNSNLRKNKALIDELIVTGDYSEGGVGDRCVAEAVRFIDGAGHFKGVKKLEYKRPIHVELKMDVPPYKEGMPAKELKDRRFKLSFLKRNGFTEKRGPSKSSGISEYERILPNK